MKLSVFEKACKKTGDDPNILPGVEGLSEIAAKRTIAGYKLEIIERATNGTWQPDFNDPNQLKYTGWMNWSPSLSRFVYTNTNYTNTNTNLSAQFAYKIMSSAGPGNRSKKSHTKYRVLVPKGKATYKAKA